MPRYKLVLAYDGTDYVGWQRQPVGMSIEQELRAGFVRTFNQECRILGASRTDAGVHALGQVVLCQAALAIDADQLRYAWNCALPPALFIRSCEQDETFHPHADVQSKTYHYHIFTGRPLPFMARYGWYCARKIDLGKLQKALKQFVGTYDFRAFCAEGYHARGTVRTITDITLASITPGVHYRVSVTGPRFMRHMIRRIVGAAMCVATRLDMPIERIVDVRDAGDPNHALPKAPARGLLLHSIRYGSQTE